MGFFESIRMASARPVPKLNLKENLELETPRIDKSHQVRQVSSNNEDISWGTPAQTPHTITKADYKGKTPFRPAIHDKHSEPYKPVTPKNTEDKVHVQGKSQGQVQFNQKQEKYGYLDSEFRPLGERTGRIPP